jgi:hypothetical protein
MHAHANRLILKKSFHGQNTRNKRNLDDPISRHDCATGAHFSGCWVAVFSERGVAAGIGRVEARAFEPLWNRLRS